MAVEVVVIAVIVVAGDGGVEGARAGVGIWRRQRQGGGKRWLRRRLQLLERLVKYGVCGAVGSVAVPVAVAGEVKIDGRWEPHVILILGLSLSLSLSLRLAVLVLRLELMLLLHFRFHFGRLLFRLCFCRCRLLQRSNRAQRDARSGPLIQVRPGTVRQEGAFLSRLSRHLRMTGALGQKTGAEEAQGTDSRKPRSMSRADS